jgi:predicted nuclease of predicted toxin-antitoxin system
LTEWLRNNGHDALDAHDFGPDPGDRALLALAESENRILIINRQRFRRVDFPARGFPRRPHTPADVRISQRITMVEEIIEVYGPELEDHAVITIQSRRIRISQPPMNNRR